MRNKSSEPMTTGLPRERFHSPILINETDHPAPLQLQTGRRYRLRLINITPDDLDMEVSLTEAGRPVVWTAIARDSRDLPAEYVSAQNAVVRLPVASTADFEYVPKAKTELVFSAKQEQISCAMAISVN